MEDKKDNYNAIFEKLVEKDYDMIGLVGYGVYKHQKIEYIKKFIDKNNRPPSQKEIQLYHESIDTPASLDNYKVKANKLVQEFIDSVRDDIISEYQPSFWYGVAQGIVASCCFTAILGIMIFLLWSTKFDFKDIIELIFNVDIVLR